MQVELGGTIGIKTAELHQSSLVRMGMVSGAWTMKSSLPISAMAASSCWAGHGFQGDDEGQRVLVKAGLLQQRVDVDGVGGQGVGDGGDDAGTVLHGEAEVVLGFEVSGDGQLDRLEAGTDGAARASAGDGEQVADDGDGRGVSSGAVAAEGGLAAVLAAGEDEVEAAGDVRHGRFDGHQRGLDRGVDLAVAGLGAGDLADGAAEFVGVDEIDGADGCEWRCRGSARAARWRCRPMRVRMTSLARAS